MVSLLWYLKLNPLTRTQQQLQHELLLGRQATPFGWRDCLCSKAHGVPDTLASVRGLGLQAAPNIGALTSRIVF